MFLYIHLHFTGGAITTHSNKVKPDVILKNFWHNNDRFADLFNATLFHGKPFLQPDSLVDVSTDVSAVVKHNTHADTMQHIFDIAKKTAGGIDYLLLGLENQEHIHYAMPLKHMLGDALTYYKEYREIVTRNRAEKNYTSSDEFLSGFQKSDKLHPVITLCVYYGDSAWDGPLCLTDMMAISDDLKGLVSDYKINLLQVTQTKAYSFHHPEVDTFFKLCRLFYEHNFAEAASFYDTHDLSTELGLAVGAATGSQKLINYALQANTKGDSIMKQWQSITNWELQCERKGELKSIPVLLHALKEYNIPKETALENIMRSFSLSAEEAADFMKKCW